ncbi:MAG: translation elongation factor 4 [Candidatus Actinomarina sp.]|jgi:GTP-binding protein LepA|nr:translation elongation factor 4 [Acidimicrobiaceae bacterium]MDC3103277.1 translation elongation factor 4 [Acidimicrobiaceae bacterium]|tara:strand:+ start:637 stop:2415 length:1779 start_codon:yes stop_codon:yes gene_type:complete
MLTNKNIRNISIIAHVDHGKSTLADRLIELSGLITRGDHNDQILDNMDLERERGITIKSQPIRLIFDDLIINLIDTPGHVDFSYEVSRALIACDGAILLVDGTKGVQAQTFAHSYAAIEAGLDIIPVINKIDSVDADIHNVSQQIHNLIGSNDEEIFNISAKTGKGVEDLINEIPNLITPPEEKSEKVNALIFDSYFDSYKGVVASVRVFGGEIKKEMNLKLVNSGFKFDTNELGYFDLNPKKSDNLKFGEVGYIVTGAKDLSQIRVGDTLVAGDDEKPIILSEYEESQPTVFSSIFPSDSDDFTKLRESLDKYVLNDASFVFEPETSSAFGFGFRCGFLGLLHLEIVIERLEREFDLSLIVTPPSVEFKMIRNNDEERVIRNPSILDEYTDIKKLQERVCEVDLLFPKEYLGSIMTLLNDKRGVQEDLSYLSTTMVKLKYKIPLLELVSGFYDTLKSISQGFASIDYKILDFEDGNLVKLDILVNGMVVDSFSSILSKESADFIGRNRVKKLAELIPRQQFDIPIQAAIGSRILSRETVKALRKDVTAKLYGGDVTRKRKLLEKQKEGKKKMRNIGSVEVPKEAFKEFLKQ